MEEKLFEISWGTILKIALALFCLYLLYLMSDLLVLVLFGLVISVLFEPIIKFFQRLRVPRALAVALVYLGIFFLLATLIYFSSLLFIPELKQFSRFLPQYFEKISPPLRGLGFKAFENIESFMETTERFLEKMAESIFKALFSLFGSVFSTLFVLTLAFFFSLEERVIQRSLGLIFPERYEELAISIFEKSQKRISSWLLARVIASLFVGLTSYLVFFLFEIKYPVSLAILSGALEFIPIIGPLLAGAVAFTIVALEDLSRAILVLLFFTIIQQVEGNILTPLLVKKLFGLSPALVILALMVGAKLWGFWGAVLLVPLLGLMFEFTREFLKAKKAEEL